MEGSLLLKVRSKTLNILLLLLLPSSNCIISSTVCYTHGKLLTSNYVPSKIHVSSVCSLYVEDCCTSVLLFTFKSGPCPIHLSSSGYCALKLGLLYELCVFNKLQYIFDGELCALLAFRNWASRYPNLVFPTASHSISTRCQCFSSSQQVL